MAAGVERSLGRFKATAAQRGRGENDVQTNEPIAKNTDYYRRALESVYQVVSN